MPSGARAYLLFERSNARMDIIVDNPFTPALVMSLIAAVVLALVAYFTKSALVASLAAPLVFLIAYYETYQKIPPFPPAGAANKVFYIGLAATLVVLTAGWIWRTRTARIASAVMVSVIAGVWISWTKLGDADPLTLPLLAASVVAGAIALHRLDVIAAAPFPYGAAAAFSQLAAVSVLCAPVALFGGSSTGVGLFLGVAVGAAVLSLQSLASARNLMACAMLGVGGGLLGALDALALITRRADPYALALVVLATFLGPWAVRLLPGSMQDKPVTVWLVSGFATLSPLPVILALLFWRHENPLGN